MISVIQTGEEKVDDGRCKYGCCRAVGKSFPPVQFRGSGLDKEYEAWRKEKTNTWITTNAAKRTTKTPDVELVDESYTTSKQDAP